MHQGRAREIHQPDIRASEPAPEMHQSDIHASGPAFEESYRHSGSGAGPHTNHLTHICTAGGIPEIY